MTNSLAHRIESKSIPEPTSGCWLWTAGLRNRRGGYGCLSIDGRTELAHRAAWLAFRGPIPDGRFVCHRCDNRLCVNPEHLFLNDHVGNMADMRTKNRAHRPHGESQAGSKLTEQIVREILALPTPMPVGTAKAFAARHGIAKTYIYDIRRGVSWNHISGLPRLRRYVPVALAGGR